MLCRSIQRGYPSSRKYLCAKLTYGNVKFDLNRKHRSTKPNPTSKFSWPEGMTAYEDDWSEEPEYPEIDPEIHTWNDYRRKRLQIILDWHERIKNASCPESKNLEINMPRRFGYKVYQLKEDGFDYDSQSAYKFVTRTHIASNNQLPSQYSTKELNDKVEYFKERVKSPLLDVLEFDQQNPRGYENEFNEFPHTIDLKRSQTLVPQINRVILSVLGKEVDYLKDCHVDVQPRVEAFWFIGGQEPKPTTRKRRQGNIDAPALNFKYRARYITAEDPVEEQIHYVGNPILQVRCKDPTKNFLSPEDPLCQRSLEEFPDRYTHYLRASGFRYPDDYRYASIIPGHWSGDDHRCNLIGFHPRNHLKYPERAESEYWSSPEEIEEAMFSQAILVSFGRLVSQALYHGFDQFSDLDYPFSTQTIITNGIDWSFFAYQMNTMKFDLRSLPKNPKQNLIWGTKSQSIFDKEKGLNDEVVCNLLRFYLNAPEKIQSKNPTPYLGTRIQDDWEDEKERYFAFYNFREQVCQRIYVTDALLASRPPEIYEWERIYRMYFNAMPMERRRRFFELPRGFPGSRPDLEPYQMRNPFYETKGLRRHREQLAERKEKEAIEAAKKADALKYGVLIDDSDKSKQKK